MLTLLERLRRKPTYVRANIAFAIAFFVTAGIASAWAMTLPGRFSTDLATAQGDVEATNEGPAFFSEVSTQFANTFGAFFTSESDEAATPAGTEETIFDAPAEQEEVSPTQQQQEWTLPQTEPVASSSDASTTAPQASTSTPEPEPEPQPRTILIGTSSSQTTQ